MGIGSLASVEPLDGVTEGTRTPNPQDHNLVL
jgi:hypothetical protein